MFTTEEFAGRYMATIKAPDDHRGTYVRNLALLVRFHDYCIEIVIWYYLFSESLLGTSLLAKVIRSRSFEWLNDIFTPGRPSEEE